MPIRGVILDMDGTLIDSNDAHAHAWLEAMSEYGIHSDYGAVRRLIGMGGDFIIQAIGVDPESETGKAISRRRREIFRERYLPRLQPFPSARELVLRMRAGGLKTVVASASKREELEPMMERTGIAGVVEATTSASEVEKAKPEPDVVRAALDKLGLPPQEVLMLGDTPYDIEAAGKAGVGVIGLLSGGWEDEAMKGAQAVYRDAADLLLHYDESPLSGKD